MKRFNLAVLILVSMTIVCGCGAETEGENSSLMQSEATTKLSTTIKATKNTETTTELVEVTMEEVKVRQEETQSMVITLLSDEESVMDTTEDIPESKEIATTQTTVNMMTIPVETEEMNNTTNPSEDDLNSKTEGVETTNVSKEIKTQISEVVITKMSEENDAEPEIVDAILGEIPKDPTAEIVEALAEMIPEETKRVTTTTTSEEPEVVDALVTEIPKETKAKTKKVTTTTTSEEPEVVDALVTEVPKETKTETKKTTTTSEELEVVDALVTEIPKETKAETVKESTTVTSKETTAEVTETTTKKQQMGEQSLPQNIKDEITRQKRKYPGIRVAVGLYSLDGSIGYVENKNQLISSACTVKAPYAMYVCKMCEENQINIYTETLTYRLEHRNNGSGIIKNSAIGTEYTISYLLKVLLDLSDNTAYNVLLSKFNLTAYQHYLNTINGQSLFGCRYGAASVEQRKNEWLEIYKYVNSGSKYSETLRSYLTNTKYCYLVQWMSSWKNYMHKSGWSDGSSYTSASDCAIINDSYLLIVLTDDYSTGKAHTEAVKAIGRESERFVNSMGGKLS